MGHKDKRRLRRCPVSKVYPAPFWESETAWWCAQCRTFHDIGRHKPMGRREILQNMVAGFTAACTGASTVLTYLTYRAQTKPSSQTISPEGIGSVVAFGSPAIWRIEGRGSRRWTAPLDEPAVTPAPTKTNWKELCNRNDPLDVRRRIYEARRHPKRTMNGESEIARVATLLLRR